MSIQDYGLYTRLPANPANFAPVWTVRHLALMALLWLAGLMLGYAAYTETMYRWQMFPVPLVTVFMLLLFLTTMAYGGVNLYEDYKNDMPNGHTRPECRRNWSNAFALALGLAIGFWKLMPYLA